jgi:hypothetical protein
LLTTAVVLISTSAVAIAAVPSPVNSTTPPCLAPCPMGDVALTVVVRDLANNPIAGSTVVFSFANCPNAFLCAPLPTDDYIVDLTLRTVRATTDATGTVTIHPRVGGTCPAGGVNLFADGVLLRTYALASPDQDGNGVCVSIIGSDDPIFAAKLGTLDATADFDCSGGPVDGADQLYFFQHHSHGCNGFVDPTTRRSWGTLKLHYR